MRTDNVFSRVVEVEAWTGASSNMHWLVTDQLGTPRMIFDKTGNLANMSRHDYLPFGEEIFANTGSRTTTQGYTAVGNLPVDKARQKFTGYEQDAETGLNFAEARYDSSAQGRFTSADSVGGSIGNPQSLNRYAYVGNNPVNYSDPSGHDRFSASNNGFAEAMSQGSNQYPESPADAAQDSAAYDQRLQNTRDALAASEDLRNNGAAAVARVNRLMDVNPSLQFEGSVTVSAQVNGPAQSSGRILIAVGDPGLGEHNQGHNFDRVAETKRAELTAQGYDVIVNRVSGIDDLNRALTSNGTLDGVEYIGHASPEALFVGEQHATGTNVDKSNVKELSNAKLSPNAYVKLNACYTGIGGWTSSIAGLMANQLRRSVWAFNGPTKFYGSPNAVPGSGGKYPPRNGPLYLLEDRGTRMVEYKP